MVRATAGRGAVSPNGPIGHGRLRTYRDATAFLESLVRASPRTREERERLGLSPIEALLDRIGNPHHGLAAIHITGSKGKGSTALYVEALLAAAGLRAGTFTSPHLEDWNERIRIAGAPIGRAGFVEALERVRPAVEALHRADADTAPAFFDALVAAAFSAFADAGTDIAVVEAGIGARLDPTRACRAVATCVTSVELEHADRLGPAITDIAREKAAVARAGIPLLVGSMPEAARMVLEREAARIGAPVRRLGRDIAVLHGAAAPSEGASPADPDHGAVRGRRARRAGALADSGQAEIALAGRTVPLALRQPGRHMLENAALALALVHEVGALRRLDDAAASAALASTILPGRTEVLRTTPLVIADGAHTRASIEALVRVLDDLRPSTLVAVVSVTRGKDTARMLSTLVRRADTVIATAAEPSRSLPAEALVRDLRGSEPRASIEAIDAPADALCTAVHLAGRDGLVCVSGSMYMAGAARHILRRGRRPLGRGADPFFSGHGDAERLPLARESVDRD